MADPKYRAQAKRQLKKLIRENGLGHTKYDGFWAIEDQPHHGLFPRDDSVEPLGAYSLELLMFWTDATLHVTFGIATAIGVVLGALLWAKSSGHFKWEGFHSIADTRDHMVGAILMGFGGVTALGCTIGQGVTGVSTLALGSLLALTGIIAGSVATLKYILWREERSA